MKTAKATVFIATMICMFIPVVSWYMNPELSQMQIFTSTWMFSLYSFVIYFIGTAMVNLLWSGNEC